MTDDELKALVAGLAVAQDRTEAPGRDRFAAQGRRDRDPRSLRLAGGRPATWLTPRHAASSAAPRPPNSEPVRSVSSRSSSNDPNERLQAHLPLDLQPPVQAHASLDKAESANPGRKMLNCGPIAGAGPARFRRRERSAPQASNPVAPTCCGSVRLNKP